VESRPVPPGAAGRSSCSLFTAWFPGGATISHPYTSSSPAPRGTGLGPLNHPAPSLSQNEYGALSWSTPAQCRAMCPLSVIPNRHLFAPFNVSRNVACRVAKPIGPLQRWLFRDSTPSRSASSACNRQARYHCTSPPFVPTHQAHYCQCTCKTRCQAASRKCAPLGILAPGSCMIDWIRHLFPEKFGNDHRSCYTAKNVKILHLVCCNTKC